MLFRTHYYIFHNNIYYLGHWIWIGSPECCGNSVPRVSPSGFRRFVVDNGYSRSGESRRINHRGIHISIDCSNISAAIESITPNRSQRIRKGQRSGEASAVTESISSNRSQSIRKGQRGEASAVIESTIPNRCQSIRKS